MTNNRLEELEKMIAIMNKLKIELDKINNIKFEEESSSKNLINYIENEINKNIESIKELKEPFLLFIIGSGNYGKSTLINALLKRKVVTTNDIPNTWKIDLFTKDNIEKVEITYKDGVKCTRCLKTGNKILKDEESKYKASKRNVAHLVKELKKENRYNINQLKKYKEYLESKYIYKSDIEQVKYYLKQGGIIEDFIIADTPGLNQTLLKSTLNRMQEYYKMADGIIWIIDAQNVISNENYNLIEQINKIDINYINKNIIAVVNKIDLIRNKNKESLDKVIKKADELFKNKFKDIVYVSAKEALDGVLKQDYEILRNSNIEALNKSIDVNFKNVCDTMQIQSKYNNLHIMKNNIINEIYFYKRKLYKDISSYNEVEYDTNRRLTNIKRYSLDYLENIKYKCGLESIEDLRHNIKMLEKKCNEDFKYCYDILYKNSDISKKYKYEKMNTNIYFTKTKALVPNYNLKMNKNTNGNKLQNILSKFTINAYKSEIYYKNLSKNQIEIKFKYLQDEIKYIIDEKILSIKNNIFYIKRDSFKKLHIEYENTKHYVEILDNIENILNSLG